jgi:hypothetical protein
MTVGLKILFFFFFFFFSCTTALGGLWHPEFYRVSGQGLKILFSSSSSSLALQPLVGFGIPNFIGFLDKDLKFSSSSSLALQPLVGFGITNFIGFLDKDLKFSSLLLLLLHYSPWWALASRILSGFWTRT